MKIELGRADKDHKISMDVDVMLTTRLLVTADSGGGKTVLLKRLCEQMSGHIPVIVIDPEGEFAPLREKFDFVLVGPGGEIPADPRSASLVAQTLLKLRTSAICDIYEMPESVRHQFVKNFCDGLINSPKNLWHPTVIVVDEAHMFCPEKGTGESIASDSVKALSTRGRKRGICPIFATQRLSEFNKGASSMCLNRLVGGTFEDVNVARAVQVLSIPANEKHDFVAQIKLLEPGYFYALGRAICKERTLFKVGAITTPHGKEAQKYAAVPPPPPEEIAKLIPKLADLPKTAEEKAKTEAELRKEIRELKAQMRIPITLTSVPSSRTNSETSAAKLGELNLALRASKQTIATIHADAKAFRSRTSRLLKDLTALAHAAAAWVDKPLPTIETNTKISGAEIQKGEAFKERSREPFERGATERVRPHHRPPENHHGDETTNGDLPRPIARILSALAEFQAIGVEDAARSMVASWLGVKATTGSFKNYLSELRVRGLIVDLNGGNIKLTEAGAKYVPAVDSPATTKDLLERAASVFGGTPAKILRFIHSRYPEPVSREEIGEYVGNSPTTGSFKNYLSELRVAKMIQDTPDRRLVAAEWMFID
jgi:hypothetical protein